MNNTGPVRIAETQHLWCVGLRPDGQACGARAMRGSQYCFWHDPDKEEERRDELARREQLAGVPILSESMALDTVADVEALLRQVALYLATGGRVEPRRATALTGVADRLLRAIRIKELQAELAAARQEIERLQQRCAEYERAAAAPELQFVYAEPAEARTVRFEPCQTGTQGD
jgi:hypothetical protein